MQVRFVKKLFPLKIFFRIISNDFLYWLKEIGWGCHIIGYLKGGTTDVQFVKPFRL
ncbi:hypothetical protein M081_2372 [Bacteroides fragilis str. 3998 T(B) 4]|nr:hypothetical protein M081_2372 [Bacteroides fragilis str. 3998 T(B) 4]